MEEAWRSLYRYLDPLGIKEIVISIVYNHIYKTIIASVKVDTCDSPLKNI